MMLKLKYFGMIAELISSQEELLDVNLSSVTELEKYLWEKYPNLQDQNFKIVVNHNLVAKDFKLMGGEEIALLPPFAGG